MKSRKPLVVEDDIFVELLRSRILSLEFKIEFNNFNTRNTTNAEIQSTQGIRRYNILIELS